MTTFLSVLAVISSLTLIISVAMQEGAQDGALSGLASDPIWGKNKGIGKEYTLKRVTIIAAVLFIVTHLALTAM